MNGIESTGSVSFTNPAAHKADMPAKPAAARSNGMTGALRLSGEFLNQTMREAGFVDLQAGSLDRFKALVKFEQQPEEQAVEVSFDPVTASEVAARMGAQSMGEVNLILRILAQVDPGRVAVLLR